MHFSRHCLQMDLLAFIPTPNGKYCDFDKISIQLKVQKLPLTLLLK